MYVQFKRATGWVGHAMNRDNFGQTRAPCVTASGQEDNVRYMCRRYDATRGWPKQVVWLTSQGTPQGWIGGSQRYSWTSFRVVEEGQVPVRLARQLAAKLIDGIRRESAMREINNAAA